MIIIKSKSKRTIELKSSNITLTKGAIYNMSIMPIFTNDCIFLINFKTGKFPNYEENSIECSESVFYKIFDVISVNYVEKPHSTLVSNLVNSLKSASRNYKIKSII